MNKFASTLKTPVAIDAPSVTTSPDGITWTDRSRGSGNILNAITFGNGLFVVVGDSGEVITSPIGTTT